MALPADVEELLPLSPAQMGMLFHVIDGEAASGQYVAVLSCTLTGPLDPDRLRQVMQQAVEQRDAYRAGFVWDGVKTPLQVVKKAVTLPWEVSDWREDRVSTQETRLNGLILAERQRQFDLKTPPLMKAHLIQLEEEKHALVWTIHHLISDGWSTSVVFNDILRLYAGDETPVPKSARFRDYLGWLKRQDHAAARAFWGDELRGLAAPTALSIVEGEQAVSAVHGQVEKALDADVMERCRQFAKRIGVTPNTVLSGVWALVLRRWSMTNDVVFGQTSAARPPQVPGISHAAGAFINTLPLRLQMDGAEAAQEFLKRVEVRQRACANFDFAALSDVQKGSELPAGSALFDCVFASQTPPDLPPSAGDLQLSNLRSVQSSNYALTLVASPSEFLRLELYHDPHRVDRSQAQLILAEYEAALAQVLAHPEIALKDIRWGHEPALEPAHDIEDVVVRVQQRAAAHPDTLALSDGADSLSYGCLWSEATLLAVALKDAGVTPGDIVPVALPRGVHSIVGFIGVMMVGAAYVPIDLSYPKGRIEQIIKTVAPRHIVADGAADELIDLADVQRIALTGLPPADPAFAPVAGPLAYVMFTSGSQGRPKGVEITRNNLAYSTAARDVVYEAAPEAYLLLSSLAFDSSVAGIYWTLCRGGHLVIAPERIEQDAVRLGEMIATHRITHTLCLPSLYREMLDLIPAQTLSSFKTVIAAGEPLPPDLPPRHRVVLPTARLYNEYGPTEGTVWASVYDATDHDASAPVPIGQGYPGMFCAVCDVDGAPVPTGVIGEIVIGGATVARGYLAATETANFATAPITDTPTYRTGDLGVLTPTGDILFLGRKDAQIKIRGHRIEPAEIETVAKSVLVDQESVVTAVPSGPSLKLCLCVQAVENAQVEAALRAAVEHNLPASHHPDRILFLPAFPRLPNGKIDRTALAQVAASETQDSKHAEPPKTDLEQQLAQIWQDVLKAEVTGRDDNFFDLGGDSLKSIAVLSQARKMGINLRPTDIFEAPTLRQLAAHLIATSDRDVGEVYDPKYIVANRGGRKPPVVILYANIALFRNVARALGPEHEVSLLHSNHLSQTPKPFRESVEHLAEVAVAQMDALGHPGPFALCAYSAAAPVVLEMARLLGEDRVAGVNFIDPPYRVVAAEPISLRSRAAFRHDIKTRALLWARMARHAVRTLYHSAGLQIARDKERHRIGLVTSAQVFALGRYRVPRYDGPVQIMLTPDNPALEPDGVWDRQLSSKTCEDVPFDHYELFRTDEAAMGLATRLVRFVRAL